MRMATLQRYLEKSNEKLNIKSQIFYYFYSSSIKENNFSTIFNDACLSSLD